MNLTVFTILFIGLLGLMVYTNPKKDQYAEHAFQLVINESESSQNDKALVKAFLGNIGSTLLASSTERTDYIAFSYFHTEFGDRKIKCYGMFNNFFGCKHHFVKGAKKQI